jgi:flagellar hook-length control protein FliK
MNMPVLPVTRPSSPPADSAAHPADAGAASDTPAFSNVLSSQQRGTAAADKPQAPAEAGRAETKKQDPLGPDETLALILDSTALPLMQAPAQVQAALRRAAGDAAATEADAASGRRADSRRADPSVPLLADAPVGGEPAAAERTGTQPAAARAGKALPVLVPAAAQAAADARQPDADTAAPARTPAPARAGAAAAVLADKGAATGQPASSDGPAAARHSTSAALPAALPADTLAAAIQAPAPAGASLLPASPAVPATTQISVPTPLSSPQWPQDASRQIFNLTQSGTSGHTVLMHVNPPELGPVHITLHLGDSTAQASFVSPHANVRQALENALPHLEQQLAQAGLSLGQANVSDQQPGQQQEQAAQGGRQNGGATFSLDGGIEAAGSVAAAGPASRPAPNPDALVDTFV